MHAVKTTKTIKKAKTIKPAKTPTSTRTVSEKHARQEKERYVEAVGRRKTAVARVRLFQRDSGAIEINGKTHNEYFAPRASQHIVESPFQKTTGLAQFFISVHVKGGGIHAQAEAVRHGIARALLASGMDEETHKKLKHAGYLKRDPRMKERRKFGLKKARRAPQWSKR